MLNQIAACEEFWAAEEYRPGRPLREQLETKAAQMLGVWTSEKELVSFVSFECFPKECYIIHAFTDSRWRCQGLCVKLIDSLKLQAKERSQHLYLETTRQARSFWIQKCGFFRAGRRFSSRIQRHHLVYLHIPPYPIVFRDFI